MPVPPLTTGTCITQVPQRHSLNVLVDGPLAGGIPGEVAVATHGPRDGQRGSFGPLPTPGTRGLIAFPRGDLRNGVWVCSLPGPLLDTNHGSPGAGSNASHTALPSGAWRYDAEGGQSAVVYPDGTQVLVGYATPPVITRHTLGGNQEQLTVPFGQGQRVKAAPAPFGARVIAAGGATASLNPDGSVLVSSVGGATVLLNTDGSVTVLAAPGHFVTVSDSGAGAVQPVRLASGAVSTVLMTR
jgi:hypothetical protein